MMHLPLLLPVLRGGTRRMKVVGGTGRVAQWR